MREARLLTVLVALLAPLGCAPGESRDGRAPDMPDILLITIDTLRADHLGLYGYERATSPEIDRIFGDGAIFERAYGIFIAQKSIEYFLATAG